MTMKEPYADPLDNFQERMMMIWSGEGELHEDWPDVWPILGPENINKVRMPLRLLSLEESDLLWFDLGETSPNLWHWRVSFVNKLPTTITYSRGVSHNVNSDINKQPRALQTCTMTKQIGSHTVRVECSLAYAGNSTTAFRAMSQVFVDDVLAGEAFKSIIRSPIGAGGSHSSPAYVSIGGLLLGIRAPHFKRMHNWNYNRGGPDWQLKPPDIQIWLRTTKGKLAGIPFTDHSYCSFAPNQYHHYGKGSYKLKVSGGHEPPPSKKREGLRWEEVRGAIEEMKWVQRNYGKTDDLLEMTAKERRIWLRKTYGGFYWDWRSETHSGPLPI